MSTVHLLKQNSLGKNILALFEGDDKPPSCCKKIGKHVLNGASVVLVVSNKLPFIPIALRIPYMGIPVTIGVVTGFGILEFWAFRAITAPFVDSKREDIVTINKTSQTFKRAMIAIISYTIALGAQIPISLSAAKYDPEDWKIIGFVTSEIVGAFIPALSLKMAFEKNLPRRYKQQVEQKLYKVYIHAKELIASNHQLLIDMGYERQLAFIQELEEIKNIENSADRIARYARRVLDSSEISPSNGTCKNFFSYPIRLVGIVLATSFLYSSARYSYDASEETISNTTATGITFATVSVLSNAFIMYAALQLTLMRIYNSTYSLFTCTYKRSLAEQINLKLSFALKVGMFVLDVLGSGVMYQIWKDYYADSEFQQLYFITTNCLSIFLLLFTAALDTTDDIIYMVQKQSNTLGYRKKLVELNDIFKKIENQFISCPIDTFAIFLRELPEDLKKQLIDRFLLTTEELDVYLQ